MTHWCEGKQTNRDTTYNQGERDRAEGNVADTNQKTEHNTHEIDYQNKTGSTNTETKTKIHGLDTGAGENTDRQGYMTGKAGRCRDVTMEDWGQETPSRT